MSGYRCIRRTCHYPFTVCYILINGFRFLSLWWDRENTTTDPFTIYVAGILYTVIFVLEKDSLAKYELSLAPSERESAQFASGGGRRVAGEGLDATTGSALELGGVSRGVHEGLYRQGAAVVEVRLGGSNLSFGTKPVDLGFITSGMAGAHTDTHTISTMHESGL